MKWLVLGGARSGKSKHAESIALATGKNPIYMATATAGDNEMARRIEHHQQSRDHAWQLCEEPLNLADAMRTFDSENNVILVDCLTLWLSNCLHSKRWEDQKKLFLNMVSSMSADLVLVSNEVGSGVVPLGELSREFVDHSGWLHQTLAQHCEEVLLVVAGQPLKLKGSEKT